jgi:N-acetyl sugar amidotransferase
MKVLYNLPKEVKYCKNCVTSNQYPTSISEFTHKKNRDGAKYINFNKNGLCDACVQAEIKEKKINWQEREKELLNLLNKYRGNGKDYDCLVPGSGGKDSAFASHVLKYKYGMNPLTVTWPPILYTEYGYNNFKNWIEIGGFDNITYKPNGRVQRLLTRLSIINLLHPFQTFILGQKNVAPRIATKFNIKLVFFGENESEYGNPINNNQTSFRDSSFFTYNKNEQEIFLAGTSLKNLELEYGIKKKELTPYLPLERDEIIKDIEVRYLGYYLKWVPQEVFYYAVENTGFKPRPYRTQGTYSKYNSIDDKIDDLHYYTRYLKFGIGRATDDASQEIRNKHLTRQEGVQLVKKFDGEFPDKYLDEILNELQLKKDHFLKLCDKFRSEHLWKNENGWKLRHPVWE